MDEDRFTVYEAPTGAVWIHDSLSTIPDVLYVSYSEVDHKSGPVNAREFANAIVSVLNSGAPGNVAATLQKT